MPVRTNGSGTGGNGRLGVLLAIPDFPMLTAGFRSVIEAEPDMGVIGEVDDRAELRDEAERTGADVVITECLPVDRSGCSAFAGIEALRAARPATRIIAFDHRCGSEQFSLALKAGADGFLTREAGPADVVTAIRAVHRGQTYVSPAIVTKMVNTYVLRSADGLLEDAYAALSDREREVLLLAAVGHTNREIAIKLGLGLQTVHHIRATIMEKLGFHDRVELLRYVVKRGIVSVADL
jgi:DNA-binding NarL/FixJ family response regulator